MARHPLMSFGDDDIFGMFGHVDRMMNSMMRSMNSIMGPSMLAMDPFDHMMHHHHHQTAMAPFGQAFSMATTPVGYSHFSSSVTTMSSDGQVYHQAHSSRSAPGGIRETRSTVRDSRTGLEQMSVGHHIHERGHIKQRSRNLYTGNHQQVDEYVNLEQDQVESFNHEWRQRAQAHNGYYRHGRHAIGAGYSRGGPTVEPYLALPSSSQVAEPEISEITTEPIITEPGDDDDDEPVITSPAPSPTRSHRARKHKQQAQEKSKWFKKSPKHARLD